MYCSFSIPFVQGRRYEAPVSTAVPRWGAEEGLGEETEEVVHKGSQVQSEESELSLIVSEDYCCQ